MHLRSFPSFSPSRDLRISGGLVLLLLAGLLFGGSVHGADIVWTNTAGGNWATAANWSPAQVPGTNDTAWLTNAGTYTVTINADAAAGRLNFGSTGGGQQTINHTAGTLALQAGGGGSSLGVYSLAGGTLTGADRFTLGGSFKWSAGSLGVGNSGLIVETKAGVAISSGATKFFYAGVLVNEGLGSWSGGQVYFYNAALFSNALNAVFDLGSDGPAFGWISLWGGSPALANAGTMRKTNGTGTTAFALPVNNSGLVDDSTGTLSLDVGGESSGQFLVGKGGTLALSGTHTLRVGSSLSGAGAVWVYGGAFNVQGGFTAASLTNNSGTITFASGLIPTITNLLLNGGTLLGNDQVLVPGQFTWSGGTVGSAGSSLKVTADDGIRFNGNSKYFQGGTLINRGTASWTGGQVVFYNTAVLSNAPGGVLDFPMDGDAFGWFPGGNPAVANAGSLRKNGGTGTTSIGPIFNNYNYVATQSGTLSLNGGGTNSGLIYVGSGTTLVLGGTHTLPVLSSLNGPGAVWVQGGALNVQSDLAVGSLTNSAGTVTFASGFNPTITNLLLSGGTLLGSDLVLVPEVFTWSSGTLGSAGSSLKLSAEGGINFNGATKYFQGGTLVNNGNGGWSGGQVVFYNNAVLSNAPGVLFDLRADGSALSWFAAFGGSPALLNEGFFRKSTGSGTTSIDVPVRNSGEVRANRGTMSLGYSFIQNAGLTALSGGSVAFAQTAQFLGGQLAGYGTVTGSVSNNATLDVGGSSPMDLLAITGNYTQGPGAHLLIELGGAIPGVTHDQLSVGGTATLAGALDLAYRNGFVPPPGNVFTVLVATARSGTFSTVQSPYQTLTPLYDAKNAMVTLGNAPPTAQLSVDSTWLACHTFTLHASATDFDGAVTNLTLLLGTNVLASFTNGAARVLTISYDFPGPATFTAQAVDNQGALGTASVSSNIATRPLLTLDPIGFQTDLAFKLCMAGAAGSNYQVLASTNLAQTNWTALGTMESTNGIWRFLDATATNSPQRYYRARQLP